MILDVYESSLQALTTTRIEFDALEEEVNSIHGDLWEQLNTGGHVRQIHQIVYAVIIIIIISYQKTVNS